jgi:putative DNA primase/helicase
MRGILNSGHTRDSAFVVRVAGDDLEPRRFSTWGMKSLALIGKLPPTLRGRSIEVCMSRKLPGETVEKLRHADPELFVNLARRCARWAADHADKVRAARPSMPDGLHGRAEDNWEGLIGIAEVAGGGWPELARSAALALSGVADPADDTPGVQLLSDIRDVFEEQKWVAQIATPILIEALCGIEDRPWATSSRGKPLTADALARKLKPFGVRPQQFWEGKKEKVREDGKKERGYRLIDLKDPFRRYLASQPGRPGRTQAGCGSQPFSQPGRNPNPTGYENRPEPSPDAGSTGSTGSERGDGREEGNQPPWGTRL